MKTHKFNDGQIINTINLSELSDKYSFYYRTYYNWQSRYKKFESPRLKKFKELEIVKRNFAKGE